jgi:hypothetical protein
MPLRLACAAVLAVLLAACQPYVYEVGEFNRERADFGRERTDIATVDVCYATRSTSAQNLLTLAEAECGKFGKTARYQYSDVLECPLATPFRARFACQTP